MMADTAHRNLALEMHSYLSSVLQQHINTAIENTDWVKVDANILGGSKEGVDALDAAVRAVHPYADLHVKYDVVASMKVEHGQLVLHELVKLTPDAGVHSTMLADAAREVSWLSFAMTLPWLHIIYYALRLTQISLNIANSLHFNELSARWIDVFSKRPNGRFGYCACSVDSPDVWPTQEVNMRNPGGRLVKILNRTQRITATRCYSQRAVAAVSCRHICSQVQKQELTPSMARTELDENWKKANHELELRQKIPRANNTAAEHEENCAGPASKSSALGRVMSGLMAI